MASPNTIDISNASSQTPPSKNPTEKWSVQIALAAIPNPPSSSPSTTTPLPFLHIIERLKTTPREGWRRLMISHGESISDHMYRMSIITMLAPASLASRLNIPHCTQMALVHDMAECLVGDITPVDGIPKEEKNRREATTMKYLTTGSGGLLAGRGLDEAVRRAGVGIEAVWREYEDNETLEARFVHDVDKLELVLQMVEYERRGGGDRDLGDFVPVAERIVLKEMREWCADVLREREEFWRGVGKEVSQSGRARAFIESVEKGDD